MNRLKKVQILHCRYDWEKRYIHPDYWSSLEEGAAAEQPCPDVYWFPIVTHRFADELVDECESYGKWSDGSNKVCQFNYHQSQEVHTELESCFSVSFPFD